MYILYSLLTQVGTSVFLLKYMQFLSLTATGSVETMKRHIINWINTPMEPAAFLPIGCAKYTKNWNMDYLRNNVSGKKYFWYVHLLKQSHLLLDHRCSFFSIHGIIKSANNYAKFLQHGCVMICQIKVHNVYLTIGLSEQATLAWDKIPRLWLPAEDGGFIPVSLVIKPWNILLLWRYRKCLWLPIPPFYKSSTA